MKLYVGNLPHAVTDEDLRQAFVPYGTVTSASVVLDQFSEKSRGFGFVEMAQMSEALAAIQALHGQQLQGRTLTVNEARPRAERSDRRSGGGDRHGGGDRRGGGGDRRGGGGDRRDNRRSW